MWIVSAITIFMAGRAERVEDIIKQECWQWMGGSKEQVCLCL